MANRQNKTGKEAIEPSKDYSTLKKLNQFLSFFVHRHLGLFFNHTVNLNGVRGDDYGSNYAGVTDKWAVDQSNECEKPRGERK